MKQKAIAITLLLLISSALVFTVGLPAANGQQQQLGLVIYQITRQNSFESRQNVTVGMPVTLVGTLFTANGSYQVHFDNQLVDSGTAQIHYVASNFTIPPVTAGTHNFTLTDVSIGQNTTYPLPVLTEYAVRPVLPEAPAQLQEGSNVVLNVTVSAANASTTIAAEITVVLPAPLSTGFNKTITLTTNVLGLAQAEVVFPDPSFVPEGSTTIYAGEYTAYFNRSQGLWDETFVIGFTDKTQYHREETVNINAVGYQPDQSANVDISFNNASVFSQAVTASSSGAIATTWVISGDAVLGAYVATITPSGNAKAIPDNQTFQIPGYPIAFTARNLAGQTVPNIAIQARDQASSNIYNTTTYIDGVAFLNLERGNATAEAYYLGVQVGTAQLSVTGDANVTINCQLTNFRISVKDKNGVAIPFVTLNLTYQYTPTGGSQTTGIATGETDISGAFTLNSTLPNVAYIINAIKYNSVFNSTTTTPPAQANSEVTVICPDESLILTTVDANNAVLTNVRLTLIEQASGIFYSVTTDGSGSAQLQVTFGQYRVNVYTADNILINQTVLNVLTNTQAQIRAALYNLQVSVKVVDYFGNPINNINVELTTPGPKTQSATTQGDGIVTFSNIIGGALEITAYPSGDRNAFVATSLQVQAPTTVQLAFEKYVSLAGMLVPTNVLATIIIVIVAVALIVLLEVFRRTGFRLHRKPATPTVAKNPA